MTSLGLRVFDQLCRLGNDLEGLRDALPPGSDTWVALTDMLYTIDHLIDTLVHSPALEDDDRV